MEDASDETRICQLVHSISMRMSVITLMPKFWRLLKHEASGWKKRQEHLYRDLCSSSSNAPPISSSPARPKKHTRSLEGMAKLHTYCTEVHILVMTMTIHLWADLENVKTHVHNICSMHTRKPKLKTVPCSQEPREKLGTNINKANNMRKSWNKGPLWSLFPKLQIIGTATSINRDFTVDAETSEGLDSSSTQITNINKLRDIISSLQWSSCKSCQLLEEYIRLSQIDY